MGILTIILAADADAAAAIGESLRPTEEWSGIEKRDIDTAKVVTLHCLLIGDLYEQAAIAYEPVYVADEGAVVLRLADEAVEKLASLDEDALLRVADELAATEEFEVEEWDPRDVQDLVLELAELARLAESQGQALFVWMHPLLT